MKKNWPLVRCIATGLALWMVFGGGLHAEPLQVMGWVERVEIVPGGMTLSAKLDTGARTSSIDVSRYEEFQRHGKSWVRFSLSDRNGRVSRFERPVVRISRIRRSDAPTVVRPVISLGLCLGGVFRETQVNLADRAHLNHPVLIGRRFLEERILVDPAKQFTVEPRCSATSSN